MKESNKVRLKAFIKLLFWIILTMFTIIGISVFFSGCATFYDRSGGRTEGTKYTDYYKEGQEKQIRAKELK